MTSNTHISINTDLTEEEIYLTFLQLLKNFKINFGYAIEFAKFHSIKVYLILKINIIFTNRTLIKYI